MRDEGEKERPKGPAPIDGITLGRFVLLYGVVRGSEVRKRGLFVRLKNQPGTISQNHSEITRFSP